LDRQTIVACLIAYGTNVGLKTGIVNYTHVANHVPLNARIIGANEHESHYVFDLLYTIPPTSNRASIRPTRTVPTKSILRSWRSSATNSRRATKTSAAKWERCTASSTQARGQGVFVQAGQQGEH